MWLGTIHLRYWQILPIFDPYPPPVSNCLQSSKMPHPPKKKRWHLSKSSINPNNIIILIIFAIFHIMKMYLLEKYSNKILLIWQSMAL